MLAGKGEVAMAKYALSQRVLHWGIAVIVIGTLAAGMTIGQLGGFSGTREVFGDATGMLYKYHKTFGVLVLFAMLVRIAVKLRLGKPGYAAPLKPVERIASNAIHGMLYLALVAMPVLGWLATGAGGFPVEFFEWKLPGILNKADHGHLYKTLMWWHGVVGWVILVCLVLHIAGAMKHWLIDRDGVMGRMSLF